MPSRDPLLPAETLARLLAPAVDGLEPGDGEPRLRLIDARPGAAGRAAYELGHLPGAVYADLERELATPADPRAGGRHPLPEPAAWARTLGSWGVTPAHRVVVYDDRGGAHAAARVWWMLLASGHEDAQVLDGGLAAAEAAGVVLVAGPAEVGSVPPYPVSAWRGTVDADQVAAAIAGGTATVVDVRSHERYRGDTEPYDPVAGHIPGAINLPYEKSLDATQRFRSKAELRELFDRHLARGDGTQAPILHCGSGVTACHTALAMAAAGLPAPRIYVGSWSEWCRSTRPIATGDQP